VRHSGVPYRITVFISSFIIQIGLIDVDKSIHDITRFPLKMEEGDQIVLYGTVRHYLHGQLDKGIVVANPDLAIAVARIETSFYNLLPSNPPYA
jgi:hypothetical protein